MASDRAAKNGQLKTGSSGRLTAAADRHRKGLPALKWVTPLFYAPACAVCAEGNNGGDFSSCGTIGIIGTLKRIRRRHLLGFLKCKQPLVSPNIHPLFKGSLPCSK